MSGARANLGLEVHFVGEKRKPECVALADKQLGDKRGGVYRERYLVGLTEIAMSLEREKHGGRLVDQHEASQISLLLKTLHEEFVGASVEFPVDVFRRFAVVVEAMLGKLDREAVERTFVQSGDETLHHLTREKVERLVFFYFLKRHVEPDDCN